MLDTSRDRISTGLSARDKLANNMNNDTIRATRVTIFLADISLKVFQLPCGDYRLSQSQATEAIDKDEVSFRDFIRTKRIDTSNIARIAVEGSNGKIKPLPPNLAMEYWKHEATKGNRKAINLLKAIEFTSIESFTSFKGSYVIVSTLKERSLHNQKKRVVTYSEAWYVLKLMKELGGSREVPTEAGNIDLLTTTEIVEVKNIKGWKSAIGQIVVYGDYYPPHIKRIHLYGQCTTGYLAMIRRHCEKQQIRLTHEF
jgi:hypothetical protein